MQLIIAWSNITSQNTIYIITLLITQYDNIKDHFLVNCIQGAHADENRDMIQQKESGLVQNVKTSILTVINRFSSKREIN
jgi:hypothetical protein